MRLRVVQAVAALPADFGSVTQIVDRDGLAVLVDEDGHEVVTATRTDYLA